MMENKIKLRLFIIGVITLIFILLLFLVFLLNSRRTSEKIPITPLVTPSLLNPTSVRPKNPTSILTPLETDPYSHGGPPDAEEKYLEKHPDQLDLEKLRDEAPIKTKSFFLEYSFAEVKFLVTIYEPKQENNKVFMQFLKEKGLENSLTNFIIE